MDTTNTVTKTHAIKLAHAFADYMHVRVSDLDTRIDYMIAATACKALSAAQLETGIELTDQDKLVKLAAHLKAVQLLFSKAS